MNTAFLKSSLFLQSVKKSFGQPLVKQEILRGISYKFFQGSSYALAGASGVGKSTIMHLLAGLDCPTEGEIFFDEQAFSSMSLRARKEYLSAKIGLVFQQPYLIAELTVLENVLMKGWLAGNAAPAVQEEAIKLLQEVGLADKIDSYPGSLSGGQRQRVALCRALLQKPKFLLADEPTGNLDQATGKQILKLIMAYKEKYGMGVIISSHDPLILERLEHVLIISNGYLYQKESDVTRS